jgi:hypothetical protein
MSPRELIDLGLLEPVFGTKSKPFERARDLRSIGLFPAGKKGSTGQVPLNCALMFLYVLASDPSRSQVPYSVEQYIGLTNEDTGELFFDAFPLVFENLAQVDFVEISRSAPFAIIHYSDGDTDVFSYDYLLADLEDQVKTTYLFPRKFLRDYYGFIIQSTDRGYLINPDALDDDEFQRMVDRAMQSDSEIFKNWLTIEEIENLNANLS